MSQTCHINGVAISKHAVTKALEEIQACAETYGVDVVFAAAEVWLNGQRISQNAKAQLPGQMNVYDYLPANERFRVDL